MILLAWWDLVVAMAKRARAWWHRGVSVELGARVAWGDPARERQRAWELARAEARERRVRARVEALDVQIAVITREGPDRDHPSPPHAPGL